MSALAWTFPLALVAAQMQPAPLPPPPSWGVPARPVPQPLLQNDLMVKAGSDRVFFAGNDHGLTPQARATLTAQARWLIANPSVLAVIEGHADDRNTRDHAVAIGERRAVAVRDYLIALGVPSVRLTVTSWGKERPVVQVPGLPAAGVSARAVTLIVR